MEHNNTTKLLQKFKNRKLILNSKQLKAFPMPFGQNPKWRFQYFSRAYGRLKGTIEPDGHTLLSDAGSVVINLLPDALKRFDNQSINVIATVWPLTSTPCEENPTVESFAIEHLEVKRMTLLDKLKDPPQDFSNFQSHFIVAGLLHQVFDSGFEICIWCPTINEHRYIRIVGKTPKKPGQPIFVRAVWANLGCLVLVLEREFDIRWKHSSPDSSSEPLRR